MIILTILYTIQFWFNIINFLMFNFFSVLIYSLFLKDSISFLRKLSTIKGKDLDICLISKEGLVKKYSTGKYQIRVVKDSSFYRKAKLLMRSKYFATSTTFLLHFQLYLTSADNTAVLFVWLFNYLIELSQNFLFWFSILLYWMKAQFSHIIYYSLIIRLWIIL